MTTLEDPHTPLCVDTLLDIFSRLNEKDLLKCKCVSKEWNQIISHVCIPIISQEAPVSGLYFRIVEISTLLAYVTRRTSLDRRMGYFRQMAFCGSHHFIDCISLEAFSEASTDADCDSDCGASFAGMSYRSLLPFNHDPCNLLDCCNGLLLFVHPPGPRYYVCNPAIRQCVPIPMLQTSIELPSLYASLAFDPSDSIYYRVVILSLTTMPHVMLVFYSEIGRWITHEVQVEHPVGAPPIGLRKKSVYLNGVLYRTSGMNTIYCFDLKRPRVWTLACPNKAGRVAKGSMGILNGSLSYGKLDDERNGVSNICYSLATIEDGIMGVLNGSLSYAALHIDSLSIWSLANPEICGQWTLKYDIPCHTLCGLFKRQRFHTMFLWLELHAFHPKCDIIFLATPQLLLMYHLESHRLEKVMSTTLGKVHAGSVFPMFTYSRNLVTLKDWVKGSVLDIDRDEGDSDCCYTGRLLPKYEAFEGKLHMILPNPFEELMDLRGAELGLTDIE